MTGETPRWKLREPDFVQSIANLEIACRMYRHGNMDIVLQAGMIQLFEIAWELGWKTMRDYLVTRGFTDGINSPTGAIRTAYKIDLIPNAQAWLDAANIRHTLSHEYRPDRAAAALASIANDYLPLFQNLAGALNDADITSGDAH